MNGEDALYGVNLLRLARLAGARQSDIAKHLGVDRVQLTVWAKGRRAVPEKRIAPLVACIARAVQKRLAAARPWETTRAELSAALRAVGEENCQRYGFAPNLETFVADIEAFDALQRQRRPEAFELERIERQTAAMRFWFELAAALHPLSRLLDEDVAQPVAHEEALTAQSRE
jgi:DNA-binding transcriptional regulator YdaS (Cro superfamily)